MADNLQVAQMGNDAGIGVIHVSAPPTNPLLPLTIATSMCKCLFGAANTLANNLPVAGFFPGLAPILICMFPVPIPWNVVPIPNTLLVGFTLADFLAGWGRCLITIGVSAVFARFGGRIPGFNRFGEAGSRLGQRFGVNLASRMSSEVGMNLAIRLSRTVFQAVAEDLFKGATASLLTQGKIELPFQIAEYNPFTGEGQVGTTGFNTGQGGPNVSLQGGVDAAHTSSASPDAGASSGLPTAH
jgi:hypothetical protein